MTGAISAAAWSVASAGGSSHELDVIVGATLAAAVAALLALLRRTRKKLAESIEKLRVAEAQSAAVLNFNASRFEGKNALIEMTLNHMNQGISVVCPDGQIWVYNKRALEYSGVTEDDFPFPPTAKNVFAAQMRNQEFGPNTELIPEEVREFFLSGKGRPPKSYIRRRPNGTVLEVRSDPMPGGSVIQTYTDITELARAKEAAEAAARAKAAFLATMSHEIRTPLNGVIGAASLMRETFLTREQRSFVETITSCGEALLVVINDILDFSKFESVGVSLDESPGVLADVLRSAIQVARTAAEAKGLVLRLDLDPHLPKGVLADQKRLRQILINLLGNAVKFTESGSVALTASLAGPRGERIRFCVKDTGVGIPAFARDRLFKEFSQVDGSIARRFGGTGLGLAISKRIVEAMAGEIGVESEEGVGSEFWFEVPNRPAAVAEDSDSLARNGGERARCARILVAEDIPTNQLVISAALRRMGHLVTMVGNGLEAIERLTSATFDLVFLDMQMPVMDGLEAARRIRALGGDYARLPLVAMTANAFETDREACRAAGMTEFLTKPIDASQISATIDRLTANSAPPASERKRRRAILDASRFDALLNFLGRDESAKTLTLFEAESRELVEEIAQSSALGATSDVARAAARLASAAGALGFEATRAISEELSASGEQNLSIEAKTTRLRREVSLASATARRLAEEKFDGKNSPDDSSKLTARRAA